MYHNSMTEAFNTETLPSPEAIKQALPATPEQLAFIRNSRQQIAHILNGQDPRLLLIVGPCSIHDLQAAKEYAHKLQELHQRFADTFLIVMRTYFEKPRTILGWKGLVYDPHLNGSNDLASGLQHARELLLHLADIQLAAATEFLDPVTPHYFGDLISWACIGARTVESQVHRQLASGLPMPVAFKNSTSGNVEVAINGILSAKNPHATFGIDPTGRVSILRTKGNPHAHIALRGGESKPNYDPKSIGHTLDLLAKAGLPPRILIDCSHDNSCRKYEEQNTVFQSVLHQYLEGNHAIRGVVLESNLFAGNQQLHSDHSNLKYAVSLTDACLDWPATEELIQWAAKKIKTQVATDDDSDSKLFSLKELAGRG